MPTEYGSKKTYSKQKTYGKQVKTHINGWFGRNLWTELETSKPKIQNRKEDTRVKEEDDTSSSEDEDETGSGGDVKEIVTPESAGEIDNILSKLDDLSIVAEEITPAPEQRRTSAVIAQELHSQSSVGSLRESSDKENESIHTSFTTAPNTPHKLHKSENASLFEAVTPRSALGEREYLSVKESPPRKRGLRKRVSASTAGAPSPLKHEPFVGRESDTSPGVEDSIKVWEDDVHDVIVERAPVPVETATSAAKTRSKTQEPEEEQQQAVELATPNAEQLKPVIEDNIAEEPRAEEPQVSAGNAEIPADVVASPSDEPKESTSSADEAKELMPSELSKTSDSPEVSEVTEISEEDQLLQLCSDQKVLGFTEHIDSMLKDSTIRKLGEASYSEVFLQSCPGSDSTTVLKIIPFGKEEQCELKQIIQEVRITKAMAEIEGFIGFRGRETPATPANDSVLTVTVPMWCVVTSPILC
jgi:hypothetical protein